MDFLRDPIWQFIGVIIALITVFVSIVFYLKQRSLKRITYEVISDIAVLSIEKEVAGQMQVLFNGKPVSDSHLIVLRIWNSGNVPIQTTDYQEGKPIKFDFGKDTEILDCEILETSPQNIKSEATLTYSMGNILLKPLLLNSKDVITLKVLVTRSKGGLEVDARIAGIKQILKAKPSKLPQVRKIGNLVSLMLLEVVILAISTIGYSQVQVFENGKIIKTETDYFGFFSPVYLILYIPSIIVGSIILHIIFSKRKGENRKVNNH